MFQCLCQFLSYKVPTFHTHTLSTCSNEIDKKTQPTNRLTQKRIGFQIGAHITKYRDFFCKQFTFYRCNWINIYLSRATVITFCVLAFKLGANYPLIATFDNDRKSKLFIKMHHRHYNMNLNKSIYRKLDIRFETVNWMKRAWSRKVFSLGTLNIKYCFNLFLSHQFEPCNQAIGFGLPSNAKRIKCNTKKTRKVQLQQTTRFSIIRVNLEHLTAY